MATKAMACCLPCLWCFVGAQRWQRSVAKTSRFGQTPSEPIEEAWLKASCCFEVVRSRMICGAWSMHTDAHDFIPVSHCLWMFVKNFIFFCLIWIRGSFACDVLDTLRSVASNSKWVLAISKQHVTDAAGDIFRFKQLAASQCIGLVKNRKFFRKTVKQVKQC